MRINTSDPTALIQQALAARLNAANQARRALPPATGAGVEVRAIGVKRGADSAQFSGYVVRTREQVSAEAAQAKANSAPFAQALTAAEAATRTTGPAQGISNTQAPIGAVAALSTAPPFSTPAATTAPPTPPAEAQGSGAQLVTDLTKTQPRVYGEKDLDAVKAAWGSRRGDRAYTAAGDANNDGVVNFQDNTYILSNWGTPVPTDRGDLDSTPDLSGPFGQEHVDAVTANFGAKAGEDRYTQDADANGDGVIDFGDITHILSNWGLPRTGPTEGQPSV